MKREIGDYIEDILEKQSKIYRRKRERNIQIFLGEVWLE